MVSVSTIGITVKLKKDVLHSDNFSRIDSVSGEPNSNRFVYQSRLDVIHDFIQVDGSDNNATSRRRIFNVSRKLSKTLFWPATGLSPCGTIIVGRCTCECPVAVPRSLLKAAIPLRASGCLLSAGVDADAIRVKDADLVDLRYRGLAYKTSKYGGRRELRRTIWLITQKLQTSPECAKDRQAELAASSRISLRGSACLT
jgi:hypothetical protein